MSHIFRIDSLRPVPDSVPVLLVEYPAGIEGTDDSVGFLWFNYADFQEDYNPIQFPGDRTFFETADGAYQDACTNG